MFDEKTLKALYMLHCSPPSSPPALPRQFEIIALANAELGRARPVIEMDGALTDAAWQAVEDMVLPRGLFVVRDSSTDTIVGTASAVHNPNGARFYFPGGGELGYVRVSPIARGQGLGRALVDAVLARFRSADYRHIWLGVQGWRLPAIRTYLRAGFLPFLHPPEPSQLQQRWERIFHQLDRIPDLSAWPRALPGEAVT